MLRFRVIAGYLSNVADFNPPHLHSAPPQSVTPVESRGALCHQKTRFPGLSCDVVYLILSSADLLEHRHVRERQTKGHSIYRASIASRGKNCQSQKYNDFVFFVDSIWTETELQVIGMGIKIYTRMETGKRITCTWHESGEMAVRTAAQQCAACSSLYQMSIRHISGRTSNSTYLVQHYDNFYCHWTNNSQRKVRKLRTESGLKFSGLVLVSGQPVVRVDTKMLVPIYGVSTQSTCQNIQSTHSSILVSAAESRQRVYVMRGRRIGFLPGAFSFSFRSRRWLTHCAPQHELLSNDTSAALLIF